MRHKKIHALPALMLAMVMSLALCAQALAETTFDGTVVSSETVSVTAPFGGTVSSFSLRAGDRIQFGEVIAQVATTKVYASAAGVITGVFGQPGDVVSDVVSRVGAVLYIAPNDRYTISADIQKAYNNSDNKYVNIGETVYIHSYSSSNDNSAVGTITAVDGTGYTVETTQGSLLMEETVVIYRDPDYETTSRIGRGTVSRTAEVAVGSDTASDSTTQSILYLHVADGDTVERGQLLYETVSGTLDGLYATGSEIVSDVTGVVASVNISAGSSLSKGDTLLTVYPADRMQVEIEIDEYDLVEFQEGEQLSLSFGYDDTGSSDTVGTVAMISHVSTATSTSDVTYKAYVDFTPNENIRLGMTVVAKVLGTADSAADAAEEDADTESVQEAATE